MFNIKDSLAYSHRKTPSPPGTLLRNSMSLTCGIQGPLALVLFPSPSL